MARKKQAQKKKIRRRPKRKIKLKKSVSSLPVYSKEPFHKTKIRTVPRSARQNLDFVPRTKIRVIGIGGGGGFVVSEIVSRIKKASFVVANTDVQALKKLDKRARLFQFGQELTYGLGTGMNSELGKIAAKEEKEKIKKLLKGQDLCVLVSCLGGGAGSGAAPIFAKISRDLGNINYGIFTLPFKFEGEKKEKVARESLKKIKPYLNALSVIPNERIFQIIDKDTPLRAALSVINKNLAESLEGLIEMIYDSGLINIDFADLKTIFEGQGKITYLNTVEVSGPNRREEAIKKVISNPLYPYTIRGAKGVLFNITGEKNLAMNEISQISKTISDLVNKEAKIIFGISQLPFLSMEGGKDKKGRDKIKITLLATGCRAKIFPQKPRKPRRKIAPKKIELKEKKEKIESSLLKTEKVIKKSPQLKQKMKAPKKTKIKAGKRKDKPSRQTKKVQVLSSEPLNQKKEVNKEIKVKVGRSALQIKKEIEEAEQDLLDQEKKWEAPAFLRKKLAKNE